MNEFKKKWDKILNCNDDIICKEIFSCEEYKRLKAIGYPEDDCDDGEDFNCCDLANESEKCKICKNREDCFDMEFVFPESIIEYNAINKFALYSIQKFLEEYSELVNSYINDTSDNKEYLLYLNNKKENIDLMTSFLQEKRMIIPHY